MTVRCKCCKLQGDENSKSDEQQKRMEILPKRCLVLVLPVRGRAVPSTHRRRRSSRPRRRCCSRRRHSGSRCSRTPPRPRRSSRRTVVPGADHRAAVSKCVARSSPSPRRHSRRPSCRTREGRRECDSETSGPVVFSPRSLLGPSETCNAADGRTAVVKRRVKTL